MALIVDQFDCGLQMTVGHHFKDYSKIMAKKVIKNDVFLNQSSDSSEDMNYNYLPNILFRDYRNELEEEEDFDDERNEFDLFLDELCANENVDPMDYESDPLFGCVCCHSCQLKSKEIMNKTNRVLNDFRHQLNGLRESVGKQMSDIYQQMNETRVKFAKLLTEFQNKLNKKDFQLEKILDISQVLRQTNDYLLRDNKDIKQKVEKVCKQNIEYRNQLGIDLRIVLNPKDVPNYLNNKQLKLKSTVEAKKDSVVEENKECVLSSTTQECHKNDLKVENKIAIKVKSEPISPPKPDVLSVPQMQKSPPRVRPFRGMGPHSSPNKKISPKTCNHSTHKDIRQNILLTKDLKTYSKFSGNAINNNINNNSKVPIVPITRQDIEENISKLYQKYQINNNNNCNHFNGHKVKKRRFCESSADSLTNNHQIEDRPQQQNDTNHSSVIDLKRFSKKKDKNK